MLRARWDAIQVGFVDEPFRPAHAPVCFICPHQRGFDVRAVRPAASCLADFGRRVRHAMDVAGKLEPYFDGVLDEQCNQYHECSAFQPYLAAGKPVLNAEYKLTTSQFCAMDQRMGIMGARYNLALNGKLYQPCS